MAPFLFDCIHAIARAPVGAIDLQHSLVDGQRLLRIGALALLVRLSQQLRDSQFPLAKQFAPHFFVRESGLLQARDAFLGRALARDLCLVVHGTLGRAAAKKNRGEKKRLRPPLHLEPPR